MAKNEYQNNKRKLDDIAKDLTKSFLKEAPKSAKTYKALEALASKIENAITNKNMDKAENLLKKIFVKIQKARFKRPIGEAEFRKFLNKNSLTLATATGFKNAAKAAAGTLQYLDIAEKSKQALLGLTKLYYTKHKTTYNATVSQLKRDRDKLQEGYNKMVVFLDCVNVLASFCPPGVKDLIENDIKVFKGAGKTIKNMDIYTEKIEKATEKSFNSVQEKCYGKGSYFSSGEEVSNCNDLQKALDRRFKNRHYREK